MVTSEQSPHLLVPLTSFGPQGHKIPAEIQPRISSDETARDRTKYIRGSPQHLTTEHQKLIASTLNLRTERMDKRKTLAMKRETTGRTERDDGESTWHRQTDTISTPMHDEQLFCQDFTERRRTNDSQILGTTERSDD